MSNDKMREEFEAFYREKAKTLPLPLGNEPVKYAGGQYVNDFALFGWMVWLASRESLEIQLPAIRAEQYCPLSNVAYREECREAIEALGLKVKP